MNCDYCGIEFKASKFHPYQKNCTKCTKRAWETKNRKELSDWWVKKHIYIISKGKIKTDQITTEMIDKARKSIIEFRGGKRKEIGNHCKVYFPTCGNCGRVFTARNKRSSICRGECMSENARRRSREYSMRHYISHPLPGLEKCLECGETIERNVSTRKRYFCTERCAKRFRRSGKLKGFDLIDIILDHPEIAEEYRALRHVRLIIYNKHLEGKNNV